MTSGELHEKAPEDGSSAGGEARPGRSTAEEDARQLGPDKGSNLIVLRKGVRTTEAAKPTPDTTPTRAFELKGLIPRGDPYKASAWAVENLKNLIRFWPADALLIIALTVARRGIRLAGWVNELAPADWFGDVEYALRPIMRVRRSGRVPALAPALVEIRPERVSHGLPFPELVGTDDAAAAGARKDRYGRDAVPLHNQDPLWDFLPVLRTWPGAAMSIWLSPASDVEQQMVDELWQGSFTGGSASEWQMYRGTPLRARTLLHGDVDTIPSRGLAELMIMSQRVEVCPLDAADRRELASQDVNCLKGSAMPQMAVGSIVHLPAAAEHRPVPGLKVLPSPRRTVPYDPPAKPEHGFRLGRCVDSDGKHRSVWVAPSDLCRHARLVGATGTGKSTAIRGLIDQMIADGYGVMLLDPHGTLCRDLMGDIAASERLTCVDYSDTAHIVPFNPLYAETDEEFEAKLQAFMNIIVDRDSEEYTGPRWRRAFGTVARGCRVLWGNHASLVQVFSALGNQELVRELADTVRLLNKPVADQITSELGNLRGDNASEFWGWFVCKGEEILGSHALVRILGTGAHAFDLRRAMDEGRSVLVNLGLAELGERSAQLVGCALVAEFRQAMLTRRDRSRPYFLVIDEAHLFQYGALPSLLDEARKFGVGVIVCHQRPDQLRFQLKDALSANAGSYVQFRTGNPQDAASASLMLDGWPAPDLLHLRDLSAVAVVSRGGVMSEPFSLEFDFFRKHANALADLDLRAWRARDVRLRSYNALIRPHERLKPITQETIGEAIAAAYSQARDARTDALKRPRPDIDRVGVASAGAPSVPPQCEPPAPAAQSKLPAWLS